MSRILQSILVVEDDDAFRTVLVQAFESRGYDAVGAPDAAAAIAAAKRDSPEMAVVDLRLGEQSGLEVVRALASGSAPCTT
jgi:two-component system response regulator RegA